LIAHPTLFSATIVKKVDRLIAHRTLFQRPLLKKVDRLIAHPTLFSATIVKKVDRLIAHPTLSFAAPTLIQCTVLKWLARRMPTISSQSARMERKGKLSCSRILPSKNC
jgi:hypothetical protein